MSVKPTVTQVISS